MSTRPIRIPSAGNMNLQNPAQTGDVPFEDNDDQESNAQTSFKGIHAIIEEDHQDTSDQNSTHSETKTQLPPISDKLGSMMRESSQNFGSSRGSDNGSARNSPKSHSSSARSQSKDSSNSRSNGSSRPNSGLSLQNPSDSRRKSAMKERMSSFPDGFSNENISNMEPAPKADDHQVPKKPRGNHLFCDDDVDFNFVGDFSKLLSMMRYLVNTINKQADAIKQLEATVELHNNQLEGFGGGVGGPRMVLELTQMMRMPDGRSVVDVVAATEQDVFRTMSFVHDHSTKMATIEESLGRKPDRDTTVNVLLFENMTKDVRDTKDLVSQMSNDIIQLKTVVSAPQATDEVCRQKVDDLQDMIHHMEEDLVNKLDRREYSYYLEGMMKKQREVESGEFANQQKAEASGGQTANASKPAASANEPGFNSAIKSLTDVFLKTFWSGPGSVASVLSDPAVLAKLGKNGDKLQSADVVMVSKEIEKLNFLVNLKTYKHEVEEMISQQSITKSQLEVRLSAFFKQLKKVFQADLTSFFQKFVQDMKPEPEKRPDSSMDYQPGRPSTTSTLGVGSTAQGNARTSRRHDDQPPESTRFFGASPRVDRSNPGAASGSAVAPRNQARFSDMKAGASTPKTGPSQINVPVANPGPTSIIVPPPMPVPASNAASPMAASPAPANTSSPSASPSPGPHQSPLLGTRNASLKRAGSFRALNRQSSSTELEITGSAAPDSHVTSAVMVPSPLMKGLSMRIMVMDTQQDIKPSS